MNFDQFWASWPSEINLAMNENIGIMNVTLGRESVRLHMRSGGTDRSTNLSRKRYESAGVVFFLD